MHCLLRTTVGYVVGPRSKDSGTIDSDDLLALAAAVYMYIKLHLSPQTGYPCSLSELLAAFAALLVRLQTDDVPVLHNAYTIQQVVHTEFRMLQQLGCALATLTPVWVDIFRRRFTLWQQQLQGDPSTGSNRQFVLTRRNPLPECPSLTSTARLAARFVSVLLRWRLSSFAQHFVQSSS